MVACHSKSRFLLQKYPPMNIVTHVLINIYSPTSRWHQLMFYYMFHFILVQPKRVKYEATTNHYQFVAYQRWLASKDPRLKNALERENAQLKWSRKCASFSISSVHFTFRHFCYVQLTISQDRQLIVKSQLTAGNCIVNTLSPSVHCLCQLRFLDSFDHFSWPIGQCGQWVVH